VIQLIPRLKVPDHVELYAATLQVSTVTFQNVLDARVNKSVVVLEEKVCAVKQSIQKMMTSSAVNFKKLNAGANDQRLAAIFRINVVALILVEHSLALITFHASSTSAFSHAVQTGNVIRHAANNLEISFLD